MPGFGCAIGCRPTLTNSHHKAREILTHDCGHLLGELSAYLDGDAEPKICAEIERHLRDCEDCRVVIDTLRKTVSLYHTQPEVRLSAAARSRLYAALDLEPYLTGRK